MLNDPSTVRRTTLFIFALRIFDPFCCDSIVVSDIVGNMWKVYKLVSRKRKVAVSIVVSKRREIRCRWLSDKLSLKVVSYWSLLNKSLDSEYFVVSLKCIVLIKLRKYNVKKNSNESLSIWLKDYCIFKNIIIILNFDIFIVYFIKNSELIMISKVFRK